MLGLHDDPTRRWEPKRLRMRLFTIPATHARSGRRDIVHLAERAPWAHLVQQIVNRLKHLRQHGTPLAVPG